MVIVRMIKCDHRILCCPNSKFSWLYEATRWEWDRRGRGGLPNRLRRPIAAIVKAGQIRIYHLCYLRFSGLHGDSGAQWQKAASFNSSLCNKQASTNINTIVISTVPTVGRVLSITPLHCHALSSRGPASYSSSLFIASMDACMRTQTRV